MLIKGACPDIPNSRSSPESAQRGFPQTRCHPVPTLQAQLPGFKSRPYHFTVSKFSCHTYNGNFDKNIYQVSQFWWFNQLMWLKHPEPCLPWTVCIKLPGSTPSPGVGKTSASRIRRGGASNPGYASLQLYKCGRKTYFSSFISSNLKWGVGIGRFKVWIL